ncbi:hypothetical protein BGZ65_003411 [Modicella reniformis]|uniref:SET domain-containing protein n=1 Tax=Modicella reniformis TaxID=1440133 RepID=A0A9P6LZG8_9FUNG|nr:hypothetical protein BGZ65_003411 [Modicella reniformis]
MKVPRRGEDPSPRKQGRVYPPSRVASPRPRHFQNHPPKTSASMEESLYIVKDIPTLGKGMFATQDIKRGTCIISESPLVYVSKNDSFETVQAIQALSNKNKKGFFALHNSFPELPLGFGIVKTNGLPLGQDPARGAVYRVISRINHSCTPNVTHAWNSKTKKEYIHAIEDIPAGAEIMTSYISLLMKRADRQASLKHSFRFKCHCSLCIATTAISKDYDIAVPRINECKDLIIQYAIKNPRKALGHVREGLALLDKFSNRGKMNFYFDAFQICAIFSNYDLAKKWAELYLEEYRVEEGVTGSQYEQFVEFSQNPKSFEQAGAAFIDLSSA